LVARKPLFVMRRASSLLIPTKTLAKVYMCSSGERNRSKAHCNYRVEGCYAKRSFTLLNRFNEVVAEVKPKQVRSEITLGPDVFNLTVSPGYDQAFVMGLIIVLDRSMPRWQIAHRFPGRPDKKSRSFVLQYPALGREMKKPDTDGIVMRCLSASLHSCIAIQWNV